MSKSGKVITQADPNAEYGALEPTELGNLQATLADFKSKLFISWPVRRTTIYTLLSAIVPAISRSWSSGLVTVPAQGTSGVGAYSPPDTGFQRILSWEVWNFEATNTVTVTGGGVAGSIAVKAGAYYTKDINTSGDNPPTINNSNASTSQVQVVINGF